MGNSFQKDPEVSQACSNNGQLVPGQGTVTAIGKDTHHLAFVRSQETSSCQTALRMAPAEENKHKRPLLLVDRESLPVGEDSLFGVPDPHMRSIDSVSLACLHDARELALVVLHDRARRRVLFEVPNSNGWRLHFGCNGQQHDDRRPVIAENELVETARASAAAALAVAGVSLASHDLRLAGLMLFSFPDHAPMRVRVFEALPNPDAKQPAAACWYGVDNIPYNRMWADDIVWMPDLLADNDSYFEGHFVFNGGPGASSCLVKHNWDANCIPPL
mmetsp:Transcript_25576/g.33457  ORF Transcript_25576/g.33457 Transcript_25576/m.33457 type:complete len:274 (+) Transcript_25576:43-864(+)